MSLGNNSTTVTSTGSNSYVLALLNDGYRWTNPVIHYSFRGFSTDERTQIANAEDAWGSVANISFSHTNGSQAEIRFNEEQLNLLTWYGYSGTPYEATNRAGDTTGGYTTTHWISLDGKGTDTTFNNTGLGAVYTHFSTDAPPFLAGINAGQAGYEVFVHEIGHALGLKHPFGLGPDPSNTNVFDGVVNTYDFGNNRLNQAVYSVMSYNTHYDPSATNLDYQGYIKGPMAFDIAAIQQLYGARTTAHAGASTYTLYDSKSPADKMGWQSIWDTSGTDTIRYDGHYNAVIDLRPATLDDSPTGGGMMSYTWGVRANGDRVNHAQGYTIAGDVTGALRGQGGFKGVLIENGVGSFGRDMITGNDADNQLTGNNGNDTLVGGAGNDILDGGQNNDVLEGGQGVDTLYGGTGDDTFNLFDVSKGAYDTVVEGKDSSNDIVLVRDLHGSVRQYTMTANVERGAIIGHDASGFTLHGNDLGNQLFDDIGDNSLYGEGGNDTLNGGDGQDFLIGGAGNDTYQLQDRGAFGAYDFVSEGVNDGDKDAIEVTAIHVDGAPDSLVMASNVEIGKILGSINFDLFGNFADNTLIGNSASNKLYGNSGQDELNGGAGADELHGGDGGDIYDLFDVTNGAYDTVVEDGNGGSDIVLVRDQHGSVRQYTMTANVERGAIVGRDASGFTLHGNDMDNLMFDDIGNNALYGEGGNDTLDGGAGDDVLEGGTGADELHGNDGGDTYFLSDVTNGAYDKVVEDGNGGSDIVEVRDTHGSVREYTMTANVERGAIIGHDASAFTLHGNGMDNIMFDDYGGNTLHGEGGNDTLDGGNGTDTLYGDAGSDTFVFGADMGAANADVIADFTLGEDSIAMHLSMFTKVGSVGGLAGTAFFAGTAAHDGDDRVIYDASTGKIYYDADGTGGQAQVLFATVTANVALTDADIAIIA